MVQPEDVVASLGEMLDDTIVTTLVLIRADDNDDAALGTCHQAIRFFLVKFLVYH